MVASIVGRSARSTTGRNLKLIERETSLDPWRVKGWLVREHMERAELPSSEGWRLMYLAKLLKARMDMEARCQDVEEVTTLIESLCSS